MTGQPETHERARPIQAITWYPAKAKGKPLTWRDYLATKPTEDAPWLSGAEVQGATDIAIAVAGFRWGGLANVLAAARDDRIRALVSLDGSVRYWP